MNNTFSSYIAAFDELNILTSTSYYSASGKDMTSKVAQIADDILALLIRAYQQGITATADMLAYDLTVDVGSMEEACLLYTSRASEHQRDSWKAGQNILRRG